MQTILFKPFERYQENHLLIIGLLAVVLGSFMASILNARFDGVLDLHFVAQSSFQTTIVDSLFNILSLFIPLLILGKVINAQTRIIDILNAVVIARIPFFVLPLLNVTGLVSESTEELLVLISDPSALSQVSTFSYAILSVFAILSLAVMVWAIALVFNGFKVAVNLKSKMHIVWFGVSILLAEILSKWLITKFN